MDGRFSLNDMNTRPDAGKTAPAEASRHSLATPIVRDEQMLPAQFCANDAVPVGQGKSVANWNSVTFDRIAIRIGQLSFHVKIEWFGLTGIVRSDEHANLISARAPKTSPLRQRILRSLESEWSKEASRPKKEGGKQVHCVTKMTSHSWT